MADDDIHAQRAPSVTPVSLIARGRGSDAQALLVLGTASSDPAAAALWVAVGRSAPEEIQAGWTTPGIESARRLDDDELQALLRDGSWPAAQRDALCDTAGAYRWIARFDFSDHRDFDWCWPQMTADAAQTLSVCAWAARAAGEARADGSEARRFVPEGPGSCVTFTQQTCVWQKLFEVGVLLVHGIGPHKERETLLHFGEPVVNFWMRLFRAIRGAAARELGASGAAELERELAARGLNTRQDLDAADKMLSQLQEAARGLNPQPTRGALHCAGLRAEDTLFDDDASGQPNATLVRIMQIRADRRLRDAHLLLAEAWWTREAVRPTSRELFDWLRDAVPVALRMHVRALIEQRPGRRRTAAAPQPGAAADRGTTPSLLFDGCLWAVKLVALTPLYTLLAMAQQVVLGTIGVAATLPVAWLQRPLGALLELLMGTLGHSHALETSPIRRNAIVRRVANQLDWLSDRCRKVVVLSHSQGAEIARLVFQLKRREEITRWVTFGAGIVPLIQLELSNLLKERDSPIARLMKAGSIAAWLALAAALLAQLPGLAPAVQAPVLQASLLGFAVAAAAACALCALLWFQPPPRRLPLRGRLSIMKVWQDYFASHDPVPARSMFKGLEPDLARLGIAPPAEFEIFNTRFGPSDHTSYLQNVEQFVAPIAVDLLRQAGLSPDAQAAERALQAASRRRERYTWWHASIRSVCVIALLLLAADWLWAYRSDLGPLLHGIGALWQGGTHAGLATAQSAWRGGTIAQHLASAWPAWAVLALYVGSRAASRALRTKSEDTLIAELAEAYRAGPDASPPAPQPAGRAA